MIAALAAGLLGQIEGSKAIATCASSLLGNAAPQAAGPCTHGPHGHAAAGASLSSGVQATLLQLQSEQDPSGTVQTDDTGPAAGDLG